MKDFAPKWFYIKESPVGLMYIGQTTGDVLTYRGSGKYWTRHIKKHGEPITLFSRWCKTRDEFQSLLDVIEEEYGEYWKDNKTWANMKAETPDNGGTYGYDWRESKTKEELLVWRANVSAGGRGLKRSETTRARMRQPKSEEMREKLRASITGVKKPKTSEKLKGKPKSESHRDAIALGAKNRPKISCIHCRKVANQQNYNRWHGDSCKLKETTC